MAWALRNTRAIITVGLACMIAISVHVNSATAGYKVIYSFCSLANCADGSGPNVGVIRDSQGNLYGASGGGGANNRGAIFELTQKGNKWTEKVLYSFCSENNCTDGATPVAPLIMDTSGDLYGIAIERGLYGFGNIFELVPNARRTKWTLHVLHGFCEVQTPHCGDGALALGGLSYLEMATGAPYDGISPLYGTAQQGGAHGGGLVYQLTHKKGNWIETPVYDFCAAAQACADGSAPATSVFVKDSSNIFGTGVGGGANGGGVIFQLTRRPTVTKSDWKETVLYNFCALTNCADGSYPTSQPLFDGQGNIFGTTTYGGTDSCSEGKDCGVLFELAPDGSETVLHAFCSQQSCLDGGAPEGSLISDTAGALYGTTLGIDERGTLFKYDGSFNVLYTFCSGQGCPDGDQPYNVTLATDGAGNMFGTTRAGGAFGNGVVFEWKP